LPRPPRRRRRRHFSRSRHRFAVPLARRPRRRLIVGPGILVLLLGLVLLGGALAHRGLDLDLDLVAQVLLAAVVLGAELVPAAELPELGGRDLELVGDPGIGTPLADPAANLVEL
jgi:hypothetical protein